MCDILHLVKPHRRPLYNRDQVEFETSLRTYEHNSSRNNDSGEGSIEKPVNFSLIPHRSRPGGMSLREEKKIEPVTFLPPMRPGSAARMRLVSFVQRAKGMRLKGFPKNVEMISALYKRIYDMDSEGPNAFPSYTGKLREVNCNKTRHLYKNGKSLSIVAWETGLRFYKNT